MRWLWLMLLVTRVAAQRVRILPVPAWVKEEPVHMNEALAQRDMEDGYVHFLADRQFNIGNAATYHRNVLCLETEAGVQNASQVSVSFDPSYEQVIFHYIRIIRGVKVIDALKRGGFKIIHQEKDIYKSIYNGSLTAMLFLKDVRKGDRLDYAYTVLGNNPVFQDKFSQTLDVGYSVPVTHLRYRVVCPEGRNLRVRKSENTIPEPQVSMVPGARVYAWKLDDVPGYDDEDDAPSWYTPYPSIQVSEFNSWKEVNDWALSLFQMDRKVSGALAEKIKHIHSTCPTKETEVLSALRFVQDEVRYLGIEMGRNTHQPHEPEQVFDQRFGDCKDKALLLCIMLRNLGIQANPVLINADEKGRLWRELPSTDDFDHATVRVFVDGHFFWLDPTISFQRGTLRDISYPDYQCGLVLTDTTTALTRIPLQDKGAVACHELFWIDSLSGSARLDITTRYTGSFADEARGDFNNSSRGEIQKNYLDFYADSYDGIRVRDSMRVVDTATDGTFITHEYYTVPKLWARSADGPKASFDAALIRSILPKLKDKSRKEPFALSFPNRYVETLEIRLPEDCDLATRNKEVEDPGFIFHTTVRSSGRTLRLTYTYETRKDYVQAGDSRSAYHHLDKVRDELGYVLAAKGLSGWAEDEDAPGGSHPLRNLWLGIALGVVGTSMVFLMIRRRPVK